MEKITTRAELLYQLENIRALEARAKRSYEQDLASFKNLNLTEKIKKIAEDEARHIALLEELIDMLKKGF